MARINHQPKTYQQKMKTRLFAMSTFLLIISACSTSSPLQTKTECTKPNQSDCVTKEMVTERVIIGFIDEKSLDHPDTILYLENISGSKISFIQLVGTDAAVYLIQSNDKKHLGEVITRLKQQVNSIFKYVEIDGKMTIQH